MTDKQTMPASDVAAKIDADHQIKRPNFGELIPTVEYHVYEATKAYIERVKQSHAELLKVVKWMMSCEENGDPDIMLDFAKQAIANAEKVVGDE